MSIPNDVAVELANRVAQITVANGFASDAGLKVFRGRRRLMPGQLPCVVVLERKTVPLEQSRTDAKVRAEFVIEGHAEGDPDNPNDMGHLLDSDIMRAIFDAPEFVYGEQRRRTSYEYGGTEISPREDGSKHVATAVDVAVEYVIQKANP